ncbi:rRNA pseudouridine synthase [bacterium]|nr:rRNA pseudouridine synthase [bacterium]
MSEKELVRLQKLIARSGIASRREAERLILDGLVCVDGAIIRELGTRVSVDARISVRGETISESPRVYLALNKPRGYLCSSDTSSQFPSFLDLFPKDLRFVHHVGRLDVASEGLLLATSDGALTQIVTHPSFEVPKFYEVELRGEIPADLEDRCCRGEEVDGEWLKFESAGFESRGTDDPLLKVRLIGGKNREIRRLLEFCGVGVRRLVRVAIGGLYLGSLRSGAWRNLTEREVNALFDFGKTENR